MTTIEILMIIFELIFWIAIITNTVTQVQWRKEEREKDRNDKTQETLDKISYSVFLISRNTNKHLQKTKKSI